MMRVMRDTLIFLLIVAVGVLGSQIRWQNFALINQQRQIKELSAKLESKSKSAGLELQAQCAKQAAVVYKDNGVDGKSFSH